MPIAHLSGVLCCGNIVRDIAVWPVSEFDWNTTRWVETIAEGTGGNGANTSFALARLGVKVRLLSIAGADTQGDWLLGQLTSAGVDTSRVIRSRNLPTPSTVVLIQRGGARKFLHRPGASGQLSSESLEISADGQYSHFHFANPFAFPLLRDQTASLLKRAKAAGLTTSMDMGWDSKGRWMEDLREALPWTDLLFANEAEAQMLGGNDNLREACGVSGLVVKTGATGCLVAGEGGIEAVAGFAVEAVDTTGAGDCFVAGFLTGLQQGWNYAACAKLANAVGALNVQQIGASAGVRSLADTLKWVNEFAVN